jgi:hypothetical protein
MAGLVPAIHVGTCTQGPGYSAVGRSETRWISESALVCHRVDARNKSGHDAESDKRTPFFSPCAFAGMTGNPPFSRRRAALTWSR